MTDAYDPKADGTWPEVELSGVTELRVHGVGGTPPAEMLDTHEVIQVSGDRTAGVWRTRAESTGHHLEAYAWGGLTARRTISALWLLVLPFALVNLAGWMAPRTGAELVGIGRAGRFAAHSYPRLIRMFGVLKTVVYVEFAVTAAMDFAAYQCAAVSGCALASWPLIGIGGLAHDPAQRVALGAVVPLGLVAALWWVTRGSRKAYEGFGDGELSLSEDTSMRQISEGLSSDGFWKGQAYAIRLAHLHLAAALAAIAYPLARVTSRSSQSWVASALVAVAVSVLVASLVLAVWTPLRASTLPLRLLEATVLLVGITWVNAMIPRRSEGPEARILPGGQAIFDAVIALSLAAAVGVFLAAWGASSGSWRRRSRQAASPAASLVVAALITLTVLAGVVLWLAQRLGTTASFGSHSATPPNIEYAQAFEVLARGFVLVLVAAVIAAIWTWFTAATAQARTAAQRAEEVWSGYVDPAKWIDWRSPALSRRTRAACRLPGRSLAAAERAVWTLGLTTVLATLAFAFVWTREMQRQEFAQAHIALDLGWFTRIPVAPFTWFLTLLPVAMVLLLRQGLTNPSARRLIAIAWDVATFWPRAFHPLAPPSYAERAVPELSARLRRLWAGSEPGRPGSVVLLAHSQGSVLATAALASGRLLPPREGGLAKRLQLVTYGCPVHRLYGRYFPAYFTDEVLGGVRDRLVDDELVAWTNFYRDTDYVGHRVLPAESEGPGSVDHYLVDPPHPFAPRGDPAPPVRAHSETGYRRQAAFASSVAAAVARLRER